MADRMGQQFGNYRLVHLLGKGGFAEVYLGEHIHLKTQAAIKLLTAELTSKEMEQFQEEARLIAHLEHDHIVPILDFGIEDTIPFLVMKYAPNGTLRKRHPKGNRVPLATTVSYIKQIAPALQYAHFRKRIHRDVKPENILLGPNDKIWLSDFGIAALAHNTSSLHTQGYAGTAIYSAPEQIQGKTRLASDQYSLGIIVYEWLTGTPPFRGDFLYVIHQHIHTSPPSLREREPSISLEIEQIVLRALSKEPEQRFKSVSAFAKELERAYQDEQRAILMPHVTITTPGTLIHTYQVPEEKEYSFSWTPYGPRIALGETAGKLVIRDIVKDKVIFTSSRHSKAVQVMNWSPDGNFIASYASEDKTILVLDIENGRFTTTFTDVMRPNTPRSFFLRSSKKEQPQFIMWSPDSIHLAFSKADGDEDIVQVWDVSSKKCTLTFNGHLQVEKGSHITKVPALAWAPNGTQLACLVLNVENLGLGIPNEETWTIQIWNMSTGNCSTICSFLRNLPPWPRLGAGTFARWGIDRANLTWSPNGVYISSHVYYRFHGRAALDLDISEITPRKLHIWEAATGSEFASSGSVEGFAWSPDSTNIAFANHNKTADIWKVSTKSVVETYTNYSSFVQAVAWSPNNHKIALADYDGTIHIWETGSTNPILTLDSHSQSVTSVIWSPDGTRLASISQNGMVQIWQVV